MRHNSSSSNGGPPSKAGSGVRNILLDCRAALRQHHKRFEDDPLRTRIDTALADLDKPKDEDELGEPETRTAQQVAYAWQIAVRTLKLTHPDVYDKMARRVRDMLDTQVLDDPASEFLKLEAKLATASSARQAAELELADLRRALADAMPMTGEDAAGSEAECGLRRVDKLLKAAMSGAMAAPTAAAGIGLANADPFGMEHSRESLLAVAQGRRSLTGGERSWCIAEAMVVSELREAELRALPDQELVNLVFG